jgi:hypothetical protein
MHPGSHALWGCSALPAILTRSPQLCENDKKQKSSKRPRQANMVGWGWAMLFFGKKFPWGDTKQEMVCHLIQQPVVLLPRPRVDSSHIFAVTLKDRSMHNWLFVLSGRILCEQSTWCQREWWSCSWLCSSSVSPLLVSLSLDFSIETSVHGSYFLSWTLVQFFFSKVYTKFDAHSLLIHLIHCYSASGHIQDSKQRDVKVSMSTHLHEILYTFYQDVLTPSTVALYYSCCKAAPVPEIVDKGVMWLGESH